MAERWIIKWDLYELSAADSLRQFPEINYNPPSTDCNLNWNSLFCVLQVAGITANTEQNIAPIVPLSGPSPLQLTDEPLMSIVASENAG